ncbi:uncharacterized protein LOC122651064 [Telopea speciosissima]|uniref:uncharacterized protein LOC122651064 n=1 Tax=Telopea speciosissima TaxID=54955 RepID=UPI001CC5402E|nr:uncharacterized protein LOC122651064 [Telopea speciosissima]
MFSRPEDRNKNKFCNFHKDVSHDTETIEKRDQRCDTERPSEALCQGGWERCDAARSDPRRKDRARRGDDRDRRDGRCDDHREVQRNQGDANTSTAPAILTILGGPGRESLRKAKAKALFVAVAEVAEKKARTEPVITFSDEDMEGLSWPHDDAVVVQAVMANRPVHRILVDTGASVDMLSYDAYLQFEFKPGTLKPESAPLYRFSSAPALIEGSVELLMIVGTTAYPKTIKVNFMVVRVAIAYNAILGRLNLNELGVVVSNKHLKVKFSTPNGIGECQTEQKKARECHAAFLKQIKGHYRGTAYPVEVTDNREGEKRYQQGKSVEELIEVPLDE